MITYYKLNDTEVKDIEKAFYDYSAHKAIVTEMATINPNSSVIGTKVYEDFVNLMNKYNNLVEFVITKYTNGEYTINDRWEIIFEKKQLIITTNGG